MVEFQPFSGVRARYFFAGSSPGPAGNFDERAAAMRQCRRRSRCQVSWRGTNLLLLLALLPQPFLDLLLAPAVAKIATS
jgi:hypothetical protein